jgi:hypothetical protein
MLQLTNRFRGFVKPIYQASWKLMVLMMVLASAGCASTKLQTSETIITDSTTLRTAQRLVAVSVPGDSAKITTRLVYDEATHQFRPVTIYSHSGRTQMAFTLDAFGLITAAAITGPYTAKVTVTDTTRTHTRLASTTRVVAVKAPKSRFEKFCIGFTCLVIVAILGWAYTRFFTPIRFF